MLMQFRQKKVSEQMELLFSDNILSAFLVEIVRIFEKRFPTHYLGRTATQKLIYFSRVVGVPIPCSFEIYNYGPYSDEVTFAVDSLLADEVLKDVSLNPSKYSNYKLNDSGFQFRPEISEYISPYLERIDRVICSLGRFEPPQLELLATLHFIAKKIQSLGGEATKNTVMNDFFKVKGNKFSADEVSSWYDALKSAQLF